MGGDCPVFADPAGHPFCLCANPDIANGQAQPGRIGNIVFDCFADPRALASFYAALLDMPNRPMDSDGWVLITRPDGQLPRLAFQGADGNKPAWPDPERPQQIHLDLATHDLESAENLVRSMGATKLATGGPNHVVYEDPEGHPFCLCDPG